MASTAFDPYHKWLGIPPREQPPNHYRLLGLELYESDADVIDAAADRQMAYIAQCATGPHAGLSQKLLNELSAARICLLTPAKKAAYDARLREDSEEHTLDPVQPAWSGPDLQGLETTPTQISKRAVKRSAIPLVPVIIAGVCVLAIGAIAIAFVAGPSKPTEVVEADDEEAAPSIKPSRPRSKRDVATETDTESPEPTTDPAGKSPAVATRSPASGDFLKPLPTSIPSTSGDSRTSTPQRTTAPTPRPKRVPIGQVISDDDRAVAEWLYKDLTGTLALRIQVADSPVIQRVQKVDEFPAEKFRIVATESIAKRSDIDAAGGAKLASLPLLKSLDLRHTSYTDDGLLELANSPELEELVIEAHLLTETGFRALASFPKLRRLELSHNAGSLKLEHLSELPELSELKLLAYNMQAGGLVPLKDCKKLEALSLNSIVTETTFDELVDVKSLKRLGVETIAKLEDFRHITKLKQVIHVRLGPRLGGHLTENHVRVLKDMPQLEVVDLAIGGIGDDVVSDLSQLPNLKWLRIEGAVLSMKMFGDGWNKLRGFSGSFVQAPPGFLQDVCQRFPDLTLLEWKHTTPPEYPAISGLAKLRHLSFSPGSESPLEAVTYLQNLQNLEHVEVWGNFTKDWDRRLTAAFRSSRKTTVEAFDYRINPWQLNAVAGLDDDSPLLRELPTSTARPEPTARPSSTPTTTAASSQPAPPVTPPPVLPALVPTTDFITAQWISGYQRGCRMLWFFANSRSRYLHEYSPGSQLGSDEPPLIRLTVVDLQGIAPQTLPGEFSTALTRLPFLTGLRLDKAELTDSGFERLTQCAGLTRLHFSCQQLSEKSLLRLAEFKNLLTLELTDVRDEQVAKFPPLPTVTRLVLDGSQLSPTGLKFMKKMPKVQHLVLRGVQFDDAAVAVLGSMQFVSLDLENVTLNPPAMRKIAGAKRLIALRLADPSFNDDHLAQLRQFTALSLMELRDTSITDQGLKSLALLPKLSSLKIVGGNITGAGFEVEKKSWGQLAVVELDRLPLSTTGLSSLGRRAVNLSALLISNASLDDASITAISRMTKLTNVRLPENLSDEQILKLRSLTSLRKLTVPMYFERANRLEKSFPNLNFDYGLSREIQDLD